MRREDLPVVTAVDWPIWLLSESQGIEDRRMLHDD